MAAIARIRRGLPYADLAKLQDASGLSVAKIAQVAGLPKRTLVERKGVGKFDPVQSQALARLEALYDLALSTFEGDADLARAWMAAPNPALAGNAPLSLADTDLGAREVERVLRQIENGGY